MITKRQLADMEKRRALVLASCKDGWVTVREVGEASGMSVYLMRRYLNRLTDEGFVEQRCLGDQDRQRFEYRVRPPGEVAPLYFSRMDARPLADALWSGYTYLKGDQQPCPV